MNTPDFKDLGSLAQFIGSLYEAKDIEELKHIYEYLYMNCPYFLKDSLTSIYNMRKERFEREQLRLNELKKIDDISRLTNGKYYFVFINDKKLSISLQEEENTMNIPKNKIIPVVVYCNNGRLIDIVSGINVSLNILDAYEFDSRRIYADYVMEMDKNEMKNVLAVLTKMSDEDKRKYASIIYETYGVKYPNIEKLLTKNE